MPINKTDGEVDQGRNESEVTLDCTSGLEAFIKDWALPGHIEVYLSHDGCCLVKLVGCVELCYRRLKNRRWLKKMTSDGR